MVNDISTIIKYVNQITYDCTNAEIDTSKFTDKYLSLVKALQRLRQYIFEMHIALYNIDEGNLDINISNDNPYSEDIKKHVSDLKHLTWVVKCVAEGDYQQHVDFLGESAASINSMIEQLRHREKLAREYNEIQKDLYEQKQAVLKHEMEGQLIYFEKLESAHQELKKFRHDIKNHCIALQYLLQANDCNGALDYIKKASNVYIESPKLISSGNYVMDALLAEKQQRAVIKGIGFSVNMVMSEPLNIDSMDICILFGNAFDNAIEACEASDAEFKKIDAKFVKHGKIFNVVIRNTSNQPQKATKDNEYISTKQNGGLHGIGMQNMFSVVEKYRGFMKSKWEDNMFELTFMISGV